ncbi:MAG: sigma-E factor negative regulatory protein RseA [Pseudohongiellaceae bacterium]|jgi:sigma-E factor negative regulatory protein RseA
MSEFENESLSALLDGETDELELRRVLRSSESDREVLQTWARYNHAQAVLHSEVILASPGFAAGVAEQLENEVPLQRAKGFSAVIANLSDWQKTAAKMAIAASVALVFLVSMDEFANPGSAAPMVAGDRSGASDVPSVASSEPIIMDPQAEKRLRDYIQATAIDDDEPVRLEHIQDSPLYRLVNRLQEKP